MIAAQTQGGAVFHGTQYHPEHTLAVSAALIQMRAAELVEEAYGTEPTEIGNWLRAVVVPRRF